VARDQLEPVVGPSQVGAAVAVGEGDAKSKESVLAPPEQEVGFGGALLSGRALDIDEGALGLGGPVLEALSNQRAVPEGVGPPQGEKGVEAGEAEGGDGPARGAAGRGLDEEGLGEGGSVEPAAAGGGAAGQEGFGADGGRLLFHGEAGERGAG